MATQGSPLPFAAREPAGSTYWATMKEYPGTVAIGFAILVVLIVVAVAHLRGGGGATTHLRPQAAAPARGPGAAATGQTAAGPPGAPRGWDPAASAEAEALAIVGGLPHRGYAEGRLGEAVGSAYDSSLGLSDEQLAGLMHQGGAP